jgi:GNAT superfamily N-acetyltransferase
MSVVIRAARVDDSADLSAIGHRSSERFREVGLDHIADEDPTSPDVFTWYATEGRSWVAVDVEDRPVAFVVVRDIDGCAHIEGLSVEPAYQGRGLGRALVDQVRAWAAHSARAAITLTTFAEVPWNGPLYSHLGFEVMEEDAIGPELRTVRDDESARGLHRVMRRVCMRVAVA